MVNNTKIRGGRKLNSTTELRCSNNRGQLIGTLIEPTSSFVIEGDRFIEGKLKVERLSETVDILPFTISERLVKANGLTLEEGERLALGGELRSYNRMVDGKSRLILSFFVKDVLRENNLVDENTNLLKLTGYICKPPNYRVTPFNREICDVLLAVNRPSFNKSDYIPCILWGRNALLMQEQKVGTKVNLLGRIQSRVYKKEIKEGVYEERTAYEVSGQRLQILEKESEVSSTEGELGA